MVLISFFFFFSFFSFWEVTYILTCLNLELLLRFSAPGVCFVSLCMPTTQRLSSSLCEFLLIYIPYCRAGEELNPMFWSRLKWEHETQPEYL